MAEEKWSETQLSWENSKSLSGHIEKNEDKKFESYRKSGFDLYSTLYCIGTILSQISMKQLLKILYT